MAISSLGEWRPDVSDYDGSFTRNIENVLPRGDGYGPFKDVSAVTSALAAACRGYFTAYNPDGTISIFAGTSTKLYKLDNTDFTWDDVSKASGSYTALPDDDQWQFAQFNSVVIATQINAPVQAFTLGTSTEFADLGGSPPQARYVSVVNRFLVLSGITSQPYRVQWSGLDAITTWDGTNYSDSEDLGSGGPVRTVVGGEYGYIFQDNAIRRLTYQPGAAVSMRIDLLAADKGIFSPLCATQVGTHVFFISQEGIHKIDPLSYPTNIGKERVNRTFFADVDATEPGLILAVPDPNNSRVFWTYKSSGGTSGLFDKMLVYDYLLDRFAPITGISGEYVGTFAQPGTTLEALDTVNSSIDALTVSFDSISNASLPELAVVDSSHKIGFFSGANLEATMETPERGDEGRRFMVRGFRLVSDTMDAYGSIGYKYTQQESRSYNSEKQVNSFGKVQHHISTRYATAKIRIPAAEQWTYCAGIVPDVVSQSGEK